MSKHSLAFALVALVISTPAFAATTYYYVVHKPNEQTCKVVEVEPDGVTLVMVGDAAYTSKADAMAAMEASEECVGE